ncbi:MAG: BTAD domain-containing putative transcriptional regulator, partial [Gaiellales bacterium]
MRVELLGRLRVSDGGVPIEVTQARRRALLAVLALADGGWLTVDRVVDALWGDDVPASAVQSVRVWVSELRKLLGSEAIETEGASYRLTIGSDVGEARRALDRARIAHDAGDHRTAFDAYSAALVEWRGPALADFRYDEFAQPAIRALDGARLDAEIGRLEAALMAGDEGRRLVADAEALLAEHPHHERLHAALMVALYRDGRQVDALEVAARYRDRLRVELGVEPGPRVRDMELAILRQDGSVAGPAAPSTGSIPAPAGPLFGREGEVSGLLGALRSARLVSIVGFGGIGKTRLALEVARRARDRFAHGAWFVGLADAAPGNVERVVTEALVGTTASEDPAGWLGRRRLLLVLDNCEHVIEEVRELLTRLLPAAEGLRVLTTTRRPLDLPDEVTLELGPLTPEAGIEMLRSLASMRSTGSPSDPSTVARAADLASGIPLGIVLLAPHLGSGRVPSAPVMQGAFAASYALLGESARTALLGVSVFRGGWDEEAFRAVTGLESDALRELREHAWVDLDTDRRYSMLPPVREFADSLLDERGRDDLAERHATYYLGLARRGYAGISRWGVEASWHARLAMEADNLDRAMAWALEHDGDVAIGLGASLTRFWARV